MINFNNLTNEEQQIYNLISAAHNLDLIKFDDDEDDNYLNCELDGVNYVLCFGIDPDKDHPSAERAIRASVFVTRLMDLIRVNYSCYYVQSSDAPAPEASIFNDILTKACPSANITKVEYSGIEDDPDFQYRPSSHGIEIEIVAMIGDVYRRMVDYLSVEKNGDSVVYTHDNNNIPKVLANDKRIDSNDDLVKQAKDILDLILQGKLPNRDANEDIRKENIGKILEALAASPDSNFCKFLDDAKSQKAKVGQISVKPCSLLIGANNDKKHVYNVYCGEKCGKLALIWRSSLGDINENTPLYLDINGKEFKGLTNIVNNDPLHDDFKSLVLAHTVETESTGAITLKPDSWTLDEQYTDIIGNHAVIVNRNGVKTYVSVGCTEVMDGAHRLKAECNKCQLTEERHYVGNLSKEYYLKDGTVQLGRIFTRGTPSFSCDICKKRIYYKGPKSSKVEKSYKKSHVLLDGNHYCDRCPDSIVIDNKKFKKTDGVRFGNDVGTVYAQVDYKGDFVSVDEGGNVFKCANCKEANYYDPAMHTRCSCCGKIVCETCAGGISTDSGDLALTYCDDCHLKIAGSNYEANKRSAEESFQRLMQYKTKKYRAETDAEKELTDHFIKNVNKYLPYFSMKERKLIRQAIKENRIDQTIRIVCDNSAVLGKTVRYKFSIEVNYRWYVFYLINNKLIYGGVDI